jgi:hypothetical protein
MAGSYQVVADEEPLPAGASISSVTCVNRCKDSISMPPLFLRISLLLWLTLVNFNFQTSENKCSFAARSMPLNLKIQMHRKKFQSSVISARIINAEVLIDKL